MGTASGSILEIPGIRLAGRLEAFPWFIDDPKATNPLGICVLDLGHLIFDGTPAVAQVATPNVT
jgi:hypothetical protein